VYGWFTEDLVMAKKLLDSADSAHGKRGKHR
jgi:hypothetical protein